MSSFDKLMERIFGENMPVNKHEEIWFPKEEFHKELAKVHLTDIKKNFPGILELTNETKEEDKIKILSGMMAGIMNFMGHQLSVAFVNALTAGVKDQEIRIPFEKWVIETLGYTEFEEVTYTIGLGEHDACHFINLHGKPIKDKLWVDCDNPAREIVLDKDSQPATYYWEDNGHKITQSLHSAYTFELNNLKFLWVKAAKRVGQAYHDVVLTKKGETSAVLEILDKTYESTSLFRGRMVSVELISETSGAMAIKISDIQEKPALLNKKSQRKLDRISEVIEHWEKIPAGQRKEGLLLYGPPGTGKSSAISKIANRVKGKCTIFNVRGATIKFFRNMYNFVHKLGPNIVICEDIDSLQMDRAYHGMSDKVTSILLNILDGLDNKDVITICTTNHPDLLDSALLRPGRLGVSIEISAPTKELKEEIVALYSKLYGIDIGSPAKVVDKYFIADNIHGCHIAETFKRMSTAKALGKDHLIELDEYIEELNDRKNLFSDKHPASKTFGLASGRTSWEDEED